MIFDGIVFEIVGAKGNFDFDFVREPESQEIMQNGLPTYFHMMRGIFLQRRNPASRKLIQGGSGLYSGNVVFQRVR